MEPFVLQKDVSIVPWQGDALPLAILINGKAIPLIELSSDAEADEIKETFVNVSPDEYYLYSVPIMYRYRGDEVEFMPTPRMSDLVIIEGEHRELTRRTLS